MQVLLAKTWNEDINPKGWLLSEKLNGIRAIWDGKRFVSRNENAFFTPKYFLDKMPRGDFLLDGELWIGRKAFERTSSIITSGSDKGWNQVVFMVFDVPSQGSDRFEKRLAEAKKIVGHSSVSRVVPHVECEGKDHLFKALDRVIAQDGEGLMLRKPGSLYEHKRSSTLLKVKRFIDDEATITNHTKGTGKYTGMLGALVCVLDDGTEFEIGTGFSDAVRARPPKIGERINFKYLELTHKGIPKHSVYVGVRKDQ